MKKYFIYFSAVIAALASCAKEVDTPKEEKPEVKGTTVYITAVANQTKTTESDATFSWTTTEKISVGTSDCEYVDFVISDPEQGIFSHTFEGDAPDLLLAVSPAQPDGPTFVDSDAYEICLPAVYNNYDPAEGITNALMVGTPDSQNDHRFLFYHAAALVKVTYANVPVGTKSFVLETPNDFITGTYELDGTAISNIEITNDKTGEGRGHSVTINLAEKVSALNSTLSFYVPVPTGEYHKGNESPSMKIYLKNASGVKIASTEKNLNKNITLNRGDVFSFPTVELSAESLTKGKEYKLTTSSTRQWSAIDAALEYESMSWLPEKLEGADAAKVESYDNARGAHFGSSTNGVTTMRFIGTGYDTYCASTAQGISSINLLVGAKSGTTVTGSVSVGGTPMSATSSGSNKYTPSSTAAGEISFSSESLLTGDIVIDLTLDSPGALYVKEITINPDDRTDPALSYATSSYTVVTNGTLATPELSHAAGFDGTVTYSIEGNPNVASVNSSTGAVTIGSEPGSVIVFASFDGNETYKPASASYTITVEAASLTVSEPTPAKAECDANSTVTFTVTSNIAWTATYNNVAIKSVSPTSGNSSTSPTTVTVTLNANSGPERTADINITPDVAAQSALAKVVTVTQKLYTANVYYVKVSAAPSNWNGQYLIVYENNNVAFDGSLSNLDDTPNTFDVTISGNKILSSSAVDAKSFTIAAMTGGYSIQASTGKYIGRSSNSNGMDQSDNELVNTITFDSHPIITSSGGKTLGFNSASNQLKFRYLGNSTIELYKLEDTTPRTITITNPSHGTVTTNPSGTTTSGTTVNVTATPDDGYELTALVYNDGSDHDILATRSFIMPSANVTITATFTLIPPSICMNINSIDVAADGGDATVEYAYTLQHGASNGDVSIDCDGEVVTYAEKAQTAGNITYTVAANSGSAREGSITVTYAGVDHIITVNQAAANYQLTLTSEGNGTVTANFANNANVAVGETVNITTTPEDGYVLSALTYNDGTVHDITSSKSFSMPAHAVIVTATFVEGTSGYTLTLSSGSLGSITATVDEASVLSGGKVDSNKTVTITTTPNTGCALISLKYNDGSDHDITSTKSFTMPSADVTVTAVFAHVYSLTPNNDNTGSSATAYITTLTEFTYNGVSWQMNQWNPSTLQVKANQSSAANEFRFYNSSAFSGRIVKVVITFSALTVSDQTKLMFKGGTSAVTATSGGTAGTWNGTTKTLTWTPGSSDNYTFFAFYQNGKAASGTNYLASTDAIVVYYE